MQSIRKSALVLIGALLIAVLVFGVDILPAHATASCSQCLLSADSVYTTDTQNNNKTTFAPGEGVWLHLDANNMTGKRFPIDVQFEVYDVSEDANAFYYNKTEHVDQMPLGVSRFYTPITLTVYAAPVAYTVRITVTDSGNYWNKDWSENTFTIKQLQPDPQELNVEMDQAIGIASGIKCLTEVAESPIPITFLSPDCIEVLTEGGVQVPMLITCLNDSGCRAQLRKHPFFP